MLSKSGLIQIEFNKKLIGLLAFDRADAHSELLILYVMQGDRAKLVQELNLRVRIEDAWSPTP